MIDRKRNTGGRVNTPLFEDTSRYDLWLKLVMIGVPAALLINAIALISENKGDAWSMFGTMAFVILLFHAVLPKRFQVFEDRLRIVLGKPFAINIRLSNINHVRKVTGVKALASSGVRFATSSRYVVEIAHKKGLTVTISPASGEIFLEQLNRAIEIAAK